MGKKTVPYVLSKTRRRVYVGEDHHCAKLTDAQVEEIRCMHEAKKGGYRRIAQWVEQTYGIKINYATVRDIVLYRRRACTPDGYVAVERETSTSRMVLERFLNEGEQDD